MSNFDWPLNDSHFTMWDRLRICGFFLNTNNRWTQDKYVKKLEESWSKFLGYKYAVMTSSGSTANTLMAMYIKDSLGGEFQEKNKVIVPSVTWTTSVSPWIREGFEPIFVDINLDDLSLNFKKTKELMNKRGKEIACVFPTSLLGIHIENRNLESILSTLNPPKIKYPAFVMIDNCESIFPVEDSIYANRTSSVSFYFGHQATTGSEGGMVFTNNKEEYNYFLMARNHGMIRGLQYEAQRLYRNDNVDPKFDFAILGNNFRSSDISAYMGLLDFKKINKHRIKRWNISRYFCQNLNSNYLKPKDDSILFCLPIITKQDDKKISNIRAYCGNNGIEYRPIISGNLLKHTPYQKYATEEYPNAEHIHKCGIYVGLYPKLSIRKVKKLVDFLNSL
jgi:CDP-4-dehydro-6-deoxyglucose reductase, E1